MRVTNTSEAGLESLIVADMTGGSTLASGDGTTKEAGVAFGQNLWIEGDWKDYERDWCVDLVQLRAFLEATQPKTAAALELDQDTPTRRKFLAWLAKEAARRGVIDLLRKGIKYDQYDIPLFFGTPSKGNATAEALFQQNRFTVTRQLRYSNDSTRRALDLCLFINGLPIITFELKNSLTKQTVQDAIEQYCKDRDPREPLFGFGRCIVHLAVDDHEVRMCTELKGTASWFLPLNQGWNEGAGNPPNPNGIKTDYGCFCTSPANVKSA